MPPEQKSNGALVGSIIIVVLLILGGIYFWKNNVRNMEINNAPTENSANALDAELESIDLENLDSEI